MKTTNILKGLLTLAVMTASIECQAFDSKDYSYRIGSCGNVMTSLNNILSNPAYFVPSENAYLVQFQTINYVESATCSQVFSELNDPFPREPLPSFSPNQLATIASCSSIFDWMNPYLQGDVYFPSFTTGNLKDELWKGKYYYFTSDKIAQYETCQSGFNEIVDFFYGDSELKSQITNLQQSITNLSDQNTLLNAQIKTLSLDLSAAKKTIAEKTLIIQRDNALLRSYLATIKQLMGEIQKLKIRLSKK